VTTPRVGEIMEQFLGIDCGTIKWFSHFGKLPGNPLSMTSGDCSSSNYQREMKTYVHLRLVQEHPRTLYS
jgi:hypothetical protein